MGQRSEVERLYEEGGIEAVKAYFAGPPMKTYYITLTGVFEAATREEAFELYREWAAMPGCVEEGATVTEEEIT